MERLQLIEQHDASHFSNFHARAVLENLESEWQRIQIIETDLHGKILFLDGICMLTESTHFVYHEMMAHISLACVPSPKSVLVIGGGDGGMVSELVKYPCLETITLIELDALVAKLCIEHFPDLTKGFDDPRVQSIFGDGAAYLANAAEGAFDIIIIDSTDVCDEKSTGDDIAMPLATLDFYRHAQKALSTDGVIMQVQGSPHFYAKALEAFWQRTIPLWPKFTPVMMPCPFYISGDWCAGLMSLSGEVNPKYQHQISGKLRYFNHEVAKGALALPNFVKDMLTGSEA